MKTIEEKSEVAQKVINIIYDVFGVKYSEIRGKEQRPEIARARHSLFLLLIEAGLEKKDAESILNRTGLRLAGSKEYVSKMAIKNPALLQRFKEARRRVSGLKGGVK